MNDYSIHTSIVFATSNWPSTPLLILAAGTLALSVALLVLVLSRLGEARPVSKCAVLSILAHVLLVGFAYVTNMIPNPIPLASKPVQINLVEEDDAFEASINNYDQAATDFIPQDPSEMPPAEALVVDRQRDDLHVDVNDTSEEFSNDWQPEPNPPDLAGEPAENEFPIDQSLVDRASIDESFSDEQITSEQSTSEPTTTEQTPIDQITIEQPAIEQPPREKFPSEHASDRRSPSEAIADRDRQNELPDLPDADEREQTKQQEFANERLDQQSIDAVNAADDAEFIHADVDQMVASSEPEPVTKQPNAVEPPNHAQRQASTTGHATSYRSERTPERYRARTLPRATRESSCGADKNTEAAVEAALAWLAAAQDPRDGRWDASFHGAGNGLYDFDQNRSNTAGASADTAITGLALLAYLGAGHSHLDGPHAATVRRGLEFLLRSQSRNSGSLAGNASPMAAMYCHGIATLAMSEALVMTDDKRIRPFLEKALRYTLASQHPTTGGWRYRPGDTGDTSQFGWQLMSLMSAREAGFDVPNDAILGMRRWIKSVSQGPFGGLASYRPHERASLTMTAEALVCRLFLNNRWDEKAINEAANLVAREGMGRQINLYYCYYASIGLFQVQDSRWESWNNELKSRLLPLQRSDGRVAGSWDPNTVWGANGGRVYTTAMATLCLETYYRFLPFYRQLEEARSISRDQSRQ